MLSRVANSVYWMSRYIERAENVARFVDVNLHLMLDLPLPENEQWEPLVITTGDMVLFRERYGAANQENVIRFLTFDESYPNSIISCLRMARENARSIRETITVEMWEQLNKHYLMVKEASRTSDVLEAPHEFYDAVKVGAHLFCGITDSTLSRGEAWHFIQLGRYLERADKTSRILDVKYFILLPRVQDVGTPLDNLQWGALLKSASALEMYRKKYHRISPQRVAEFLVLDREFPRSIRFCIAAAEESLHAITGSPPGTFRTRAEQKLGRLRAELDYARIEEIIAGGLHEYLDAFQAKANEVGDAIFETFFAVRPLAAAQ